MSATATLVPLGLGLGLLYTGRGADEGVRFGSGMGAIGVGVVIGPSTGQIYAQGGTDVAVTFVLRAITGAVMLTGIGLRLRGDETEASLGQALGLIGGITTGLIAGYDIYAASQYAKEARYREGHTRLESEFRKLASIAQCGPIPCPAGSVTSVPAP